MFHEYPKKLRHPELAIKALVHDEDEEAAVLKEWGVIKEDQELHADPARDHLLRRAARVSLDVNPRWTDARLLRAVEKAESDAAQDA